MPTPEPAINVEEVMREIRERVRTRPITTYAAPGRAAAGPVDFEDLRRAIQHAQSCSAAVGELPPRPSTFRARMGQVLVRMVRRMLFWYTPQVIQFQNATVRAMEEQVAALESVVERFQTAIDRLERQAAAPREDATPRP